MRRRKRNSSSYSIIINEDVPEVLNVHMNESEKKYIFFLEGFFFQAVKN